MVADLVAPVSFGQLLLLPRRLLLAEVLAGLEVKQALVPDGGFGVDRSVGGELLQLLGVGGGAALRVVV